MVQKVEFILAMGIYPLSDNHIVDVERAVVTHCEWSALGRSTNGTPGAFVQSVSRLGQQEWCADCILHHTYPRIRPQTFRFPMRMQYGPQYFGGVVKTEICMRWSNVLPQHGGTTNQLFDFSDKLGLVAWVTYHEHRRVSPLHQVGRSS